MEHMDLNEVYDRLEGVIPNLKEVAADGHPNRQAVVDLVMASTGLSQEIVSSGLSYWAAGVDTQIVLSPEPAAGDVQEGLDLAQTGADLHDRGHYLEALTAFMAAKEIFLHNQELVKAAVCDMEFGMTAGALGWTDAAGVCLERAKDVVDSLGEWEDRARVALNYGNHLNTIDDRDSAFGQFEVARRAAALAGEKNLEASAVFNLGNIAQERGDWSKAVSAWSAAKERYEELGAEKQVLDCYRVLGDGLSQMGRHEEAIPLLVKAYQGYVELGLDLESAKTALMLSHPMHHTGDFEMADETLRNVIAEYERLGHIPDLVRALTDHSWTLVAMGRSEDAVAALERARELSHQHELPWSEEVHRDLVARFQSGDVADHPHPPSEDREYFSDRFGYALRVVSDLHREQRRKSGPNDPIGPPYLGHLLGTAALVIEDGGSETEAIAALLHDAVEDTTLSVSDIRLLFDGEVADIVEGCTDAHRQPKPPWKERKGAYLAHLKDASPEVLRVSCADKLYNARTILSDLGKVGASVWDRFNASKEGTLWYYRRLASVFAEQAPGPLSGELVRVVDELEALAE